MKTIRYTCFVVLARAISSLAQGPLAPPPGINPAVGPVNALTPGGAPQATMKTLHQVEPRTPLNAGLPGVTQNANGGFTITAAGSYYLTQGLSVTTGSGILISAPEVSLDLNGFTISSSAQPASGNGIEVTAYLRGISVRHGIIRGATLRFVTYPFTFTPGGFLKGISATVAGPPAFSVHFLAMEDLEVRACAGDGIYAIGGVTRRCLAEGNGGRGISGDTALECTAEANHGIGFECDNVRNSLAGLNEGGGFYGSKVIESRAYLNGGLGIQATVIENCQAEKNTGSGIAGGLASFNSEGGSVLACVATDNGGWGITAPHSVITSCQARGNGTAGGTGGIRGEDSLISLCYSKGNAGLNFDDGSGAGPAGTNWTFLQNRQAP